MRDITYPPIIVAAKLGFRALGQKIDVQGAENVPTSGGVLLAYNHIGYVDFIYGGLAANPSGRLVRFMSKRELFDHTWTGPLMRSLHHIEVDRDRGESSYLTAVRYLRSGEAVGIFPEATISRAMELKEFKTGAARIAAAAGVPLVPVVLWGTQRMMSKDHPRDFSRGKAISIRVGAPLHPTGTDPEAETAELKASMAQLLDDAISTYPQAEPGSWWTPRSHGGGAPTLEEAASLDRQERLDRVRKYREHLAAKKAKDDRKAGPV